MCLVITQWSLAPLMYLNTSFQCLLSYTDIPLPFVIFAHFSELFLLFLMICISSLYNILPAVFIENLFSKFVTCYFTFFGVSFDDRKFPILIKSGVPLFY